MACLVTWGGAISGSQIADEVARTLTSPWFASRAGHVRHALAGVTRHVVPRSAIASHRLDEYDVDAAIRDLTTSVRADFLVQHAETIDRFSIPIFTLRGVTDLAAVPFSLRRGAKLLSSFEAEHDMQVAGSSSRLNIPMATELAVLRGHHWDIAYPAFGPRRWGSRTAHVFPKTAALTATVQLATELGLVT